MDNICCPTTTTTTYIINPIHINLPPHSTFSSFKNCSAVRKNSLTVTNRSVKESYLLKINSS